jgi:proteasome lid subunit RPN8/RPN11
MGASQELLLAPGLLERLIEHARAEAPLECCGLLAGASREAWSIYPLVNEAESPTAFRVEQGLFAPFKEMRQRGETLVAIYHSHPKSAATPSRRDLAENYYGDVVHVIISLASATPDVRAYVLGKEDYEEIAVKSTAAVDRPPGDR